MIPIPAFIKRQLHSLVGDKRYATIQYFVYKNLVKDMGYTKSYYQPLETVNGHSYNLFAQTLMDEFHPETVVDVGCGSGGIALAFLTAGCKETRAFDYSHEAVELARSKGLPHVQVLDLTKSTAIPAKGDLCLCLEVAEHLPERYAGHLCKLLSRVAPLLVFTAAPPGQGGYFHVNERPQSYWITLMSSVSMKFDADAVARVRNHFKGQMIRDYEQNLMIFKRTT